jgi:hypothetical protein
MFSWAILGRCSPGNLIAWQLWVTKIAPSPEKLGAYVTLDVATTGLRDALSVVFGYYFRSQIFNFSHNFGHALTTCVEVRSFRHEIAGQGSVPDDQVSEHLPDSRGQDSVTDQHGFLSPQQIGHDRVILSNTVSSSSNNECSMVNQRVPLFTQQGGDESSSSDLLRDSIAILEQLGTEGTVTERQAYVPQNEQRELIVSNEEHDRVNRLVDVLLSEELEEAKTGLEALLHEFPGSEQPP